MKAWRMPSMAGTWTVPIIVTSVVIGAGIGGLAFKISSDRSDGAASVAVDRAVRSVYPQRDSTIARSPLPSLDVTMPASHELPAADATPAQDSSAQPEHETFDAPLVPAEASSYSIHDGHRGGMAALAAHTSWHGPDGNDGLNADDRDPASRWIAEELGATRVVAFEQQSLLSEVDSLTYNQHEFRSMGPATLREFDRSRPTSLADFGLGIGDLLDGAPSLDEPVFDFDTNHDSNSGAGAPSIADLDDSEDDSDGGAHKHSDDADEPRTPEEDGSQRHEPFTSDNGVAMIPGVESDAPAPAKESGRPQIVRSIPEPIAMPILLGGWILLFRSRRRRDEIARLQQLLEDSRSFKLPPGSSDRTIDQLSGRTRTAGRRS